MHQLLHCSGQELTQKEKGKKKKTTEPTMEELTKEGSSDELSDLSLRPLDTSDIDDFMVWATDGRVAEFCSWEPYTSKEEGVNYINTTVSNHPWGQLGNALACKYWGKGIATRAVKMVGGTIFREWPRLERLEALVDVANVGSQRVLEKFGFNREGVLRKYFILKGQTRDMAADVVEDQMALYSGIKTGNKKD